MLKSRMSGMQSYEIICWTLIENVLIHHLLVWILVLGGEGWCKLFKINEHFSICKLYV